MKIIAHLVIHSMVQEVKKELIKMAQKRCFTITEFPSLPQFTWWLFIDIESIFAGKNREFFFYVNDDITFCVFMCEFRTLHIAPLLCLSNILLQTVLLIWFQDMYNVENSTPYRMSIVYIHSLYWVTKQNK